MRVQYGQNWPSANFAHIAPSTSRNLNSNQKQKSYVNWKLCNAEKSKIMVAPPPFGSECPNSTGFSWHESSESMASCPPQEKWSNLLLPPPEKIQNKNALKIRRFFCLLVFKRFKLCFNVRKVRKNQNIMLWRKNSNNKCFSCIFWEDKKNTSIFKAKIFSCPPQDKMGHFSWGGRIYGFTVRWQSFWRETNEKKECATSI